MARRLHGLSLFVVLVVTTATTTMSDNGAEEGNCPTTSSPDGNALLQASSVLQANANVLKATRAGALKMATINNHHRCTGMYPNLEVWAGNMGDICRTIDGVNYTFSCPENCTSIPKGETPFCLNQGTRDLCRYQRPNGTIIGGKICSKRTLFRNLVCRDSDETGCTASEDEGNTCIGDTGSVISWIAPQGCHAISSSPWTVMPDTTTPCRVMEGTPNLPTAGWRLVASGTHGVTATMEVGMTSTDGSTLSAEAALELGASAKHGTTDGSKSSSEEVSADFSYMVGVAIESTLELTEVRTVVVECPDYFDSPTNDVHVENSRIEYIWQFVVSAGDSMAKTDHFRCHQSEGSPQMPECLPALCGDPSYNEFCEHDKCLKEGP